MRKLLLLCSVLLFSNKASGKLVLRGEARNVDALTSYLALLAKQGVLTEVHLAHQKNVVRGSWELMTFEVRALVLGAQ